ncbi:hypothetical protein [Alteribacillus sp. YIM 98480]|uniref:hypothetical protein n=1 Tax=Alteribacillus sp. YIM 98480 TaxID=2606599 RepID=UPI00131C50FE|nr:hypothetical protein [Alteribacillus sp. YIM 98480]
MTENHKVWCDDCGKLTPNMGAGLCADCFPSYREDFVKVRQYVKGTQEATMIETSNATGVSIDRIRKMVRERAISIKNT